jgi:exodeoxyribonuclease VII large subunit
MALLKQSVGRAFSTVLVTGEVIDPLQSPRGHLYFRLSDGEAEIRTVMWRQDAERLRHELTPGDQITVRGRLDVYPPRGELQLVAMALMQSGKGQKLLGLAELKQKLKEEGLFDRPRRPLPPFPKTIGVVTSIGSAVIHDIYQSVQKRFPACQIILSPSSVSGELASRELVRALRRLEGRADVVVVARGGGSFEELLPFSDETLVREVARFSVPVIAAVGHGSDSVLLDFVADHTAPTPTAAAVLATPDRAELARRLVLLRNRAIRGVIRVVQERRGPLERSSALVKASHPARIVERARERHQELSRRVGRAQDFRLTQLRTRLDELAGKLGARRWPRLTQAERQRFRTWEKRLRYAGAQFPVTRRDRLTQLAERLRSAGPKNLLKRGFAMVYTGGHLVTGAGGRTPGEELELHFADGRIVADIKRVESITTEHVTDQPPKL